MSARKQLACYRTSHVAPGADGKSLSAQADRIARDMVIMRRTLMLDGIRTLSAVLHTFFHDRLNLICDRVLERVANRAGVVPGRKADLGVEFSMGMNEAVWANVINEVLGPEANIQLVTEFTPIVQSVAARAYERTSIFIGEELAADSSTTILRRAQNMAKEVTRINETTRANLVKTIERSMQEGQTVVESVRTLRAEIPEIAASRIPTIARTEIGNAVDQGTIQALKESSVVTHASVIGCKAREANSPQYNGQSTCNIQDVPVYDLDKLKFHPQHTGCIVASKFVGE